MEAGRRYRTSPLTESISQVHLPDGPSYVVHWEEGSCIYLEFQDRLLPCRHATAMARNAYLQLYNKISLLYLTESYRLTYQGSCLPVCVEDLVCANDCQAPIIGPTRGRPRKRQIRRDRPFIGKYQYSQCKEQGHTWANYRTG